MTVVDHATHLSLVADEQPVPDGVCRRNGCVNAPVWLGFCGPCAAKYTAARSAVTEERSGRVSAMCSRLHGLELELAERIVAFGDHGSSQDLRLLLLRAFDEVLVDDALQLGGRGL